MHSEISLSLNTNKNIEHSKGIFLRHFGSHLGEYFASRIFTVLKYFNQHRLSAFLLIWHWLRLGEYDLYTLHFIKCLLIILSLNCQIPDGRTQIFCQVFQLDIISATS